MSSGREFQFVNVLLKDLSSPQFVFDLFRPRISRNCGELLCGFLNIGVTQSGNVKNKNTLAERKAFTD